MPCQKRVIVQDLVLEDKVKYCQGLPIVDLDRSIFYYKFIPYDSEVETKLNSYIENKLLCNRGYPEYYKRLRREGIQCNQKRLERVYRKMGFSRRRKKQRRIPNPEKRPLVQPDLKNEEAMAKNVSFSFPAERVIEILSKCIEWRGKPKRFRSDIGTEFIAGKRKKSFLKHKH